MTSYELEKGTASLELSVAFADGQYCSHDIKRQLLLGRKAMTDLDSILKSRDITLPTKVHLVKAMVFPVVMYGCESWTIKKAKCQRIDTFELWCWRRLLRVPWTAKRSNQSILNEISPGYSLEGLMLKLKLQYFGYLIWRADSFEKAPMLGKIEGRRRRGWQRMRWLDGITNLDMSLSRLQELVMAGKPGVLQSMGLQRVRHNWMTELNWVLICYKAVISAEWMAPLKVYMGIWTAAGSDPAERAEGSWPRWLLWVFSLIFPSPEPFPDLLNLCKALPSEKTGGTYAHHQGWWL